MPQPGGSLPSPLTSPSAGQGTHQSPQRDPFEASGSPAADPKRESRVSNSPSLRKGQDAGGHAGVGDRVPSMANPGPATAPPPPSLMQPRRRFQRLLPWTPELIPQRGHSGRAGLSHRPLSALRHLLALHHRVDRGHTSSRLADGGETSLGSSVHPHRARSSTGSPTPPGPGSTLG